MISLDPGERAYWHWPVVGSNVAPEVSVDGGVTWHPMEAATGWTPPADPAGATWWRVMFARDDVDTADPDIGPNPAGTVTCANTGPLLGRIVASVGGEVLIQQIGWIVLVGPTVGGS